MEQDDYNEDDELRVYVMGYFEHLMTDVERASIRFIRFDIRHEDVSYTKNWADFEGDSNLEQSVRGLWDFGFPEHLNVISKRIAHDHPDEVFANRCSQCRRLPRTPRAKQCRWCLHSLA